MEKLMKTLLRCACGSSVILFVDKKGAYCEHCMPVGIKKKKPQKK